MSRKEELGFYHLGNGYTVCNKAEICERTRDYKKVAHITKDRIVEYVKDAELTKGAKKIIEHFAKTDDGCVSTTQQDIKIFNTRPVREY